MIVLMGTLDAGSVWSDEYVLSIHICNGIKEGELSPDFPGCRFSSDVSLLRYLAS